METYAWDHGLPCKNPSCKSHGKPHPNCRCYGGMAKGGKVINFCSENRPHNKECEYYADGGAVPSSDLPSDSSSGQVPQDDLPSSSASGEVPADDLPDSGHGSVGQQAIAGLEGAAQGFAGPLATLAETKVLGVDPKDIAARAEENPWTHGIGQAVGLGAGLTTGVGEAGIATGIAERLAPEAVSVAGKIGSAALKGFVSNSLIQGGDEISKSMLGQGDPEHPVASALAHVGFAGLLGAGTGGLFNGIGQGAQKGLAKLEAAKMGSRAESFLTGMGDAAEEARTGAKGLLSKQRGESFKITENPSYKAGQAAYTKMTGAASPMLTKAVAAKTGGVLGGPWGYEAAKEVLGPYVDKIAGKFITPKVGKYVYPAVMRALSEGDSQGVFNAIDYATNAAKGAQKITDGVGKLFQLGGQRAVDEYATDKDRDTIKDYLEEGGIDKSIEEEKQAQPGAQNFAQGGPVQPQQSQSNFSTVFPEQSMLLAATKGRVSNYLNTLRPSEGQKLPFDTSHKDPAKERAYNSAIDIAAQPLSVLNRIKEGTITPDHVKHLSQMYPEIKSQLDKKITEQIIEKQKTEEKPDYHVRQGLSLFLGAPLDSSFTPSAIQAAQMSFQSAKPQGGGQVSNKKGTSTLTKVSSNYQTADQSRAQRANKI